VKSGAHRWTIPTGGAACSLPGGCTDTLPR
jgi:hypothetical protein